MHQHDEIPDPPPMAWLIAMLLGISLLCLQATLDDEPGKAPPATVSALACPGMHAEWLDERQVECHREKP